MSSRAFESKGRRRLPAVVLAIGAAAGCLPSCLSIEAPSFLVLERWTDSLKAMTPDDARIWVREFDDPSKGDLAFWSQALRNDLVSNRGYTLLEERKVKDTGGQDGVEMLFEVTSGGRAQRYIVVLYVFEGFLGLFSNTIRIAEYVAPARSPREVRGRSEEGFRGDLTVSAASDASDRLFCRGGALTARSSRITTVYRDVAFNAA